MRRHGERILAVKRRLLKRVSDLASQPGARFPSNREIARYYGVSLQTADSIVRELCEQGWLVRRAASGTYIPGSTTSKEGAALTFHPRWRTAGSFGARLHEVLVGALDREGIPWRDDDAEDWLPVIWESPDSLKDCMASFRHALLLNDRPPHGLESLMIDSISVDDFEGGVQAGQLALRGIGAGHKSLILAGPRGDLRSEARCAGFQTVLRAKVIHCSWFGIEESSVRSTVESVRPRSVFCVNDRLAAGICQHAPEWSHCPSAVIGFDDAPIASELGLTTIAIPWEELASQAVQVIKRRLTDTLSAPIHQVIRPRPVVRSLAHS